jgi:hypothetical protein
LFWLNFLRSPFLWLLFLSMSHITAYTRHCQQFALCPYKLHIMDCTQSASRRLLKLRTLV